MHAGHYIGDRLRRIREHHVGREIVGNRDGGKLPLVIDDERGGAGLHLADGRERHLRARIARHINLIEIPRGFLQLRINLDDDAVLIAW